MLYWIACDSLISMLMLKLKCWEISIHFSTVVCKWYVTPQISEVCHALRRWIHNQSHDTLFIKAVVTWANALKTRFVITLTSIAVGDNKVGIMTTLSFQCDIFISVMVPDGTKPLAEPTLTSYEWCSVAFTWEKFRSECPTNFSVWWFWILYY